MDRRTVEYLAMNEHQPDDPGQMRPCQIKLPPHMWARIDEIKRRLRLASRSAVIERILLNNPQLPELEDFRTKN